MNICDLEKDCEVKFYNQNCLKSVFSTDALKKYRPNLYLFPGWFNIQSLRLVHALCRYWRNSVYGRRGGRNKILSCYSTDNGELLTFNVLLLVLHFPLITVFTHVYLKQHLRSKTGILGFKTNMLGPMQSLRKHSPISFHWFSGELYFTVCQKLPLPVLGD